MPQQTQIVPQYEQPYAYTVINDNTTFVEDIVREEFNGTTTVIVTTADKGEDNRFIDTRSRAEMVEMFGTPNFKTHGQALINADAYFSTDKTRAFIMNVKPEDAARANSIVVAKVKVTAPTEEPASQGSLSVKLDTFQAADLNSVEDITGELKALRKETPDEQGYLHFPLFAVAAKGRGEAGNDLRVRVVKDMLSDTDNPYINYRVDVCEVQSTLQVKRQLTGSLFDAAMQDDKTIFLEDVVADDDSAFQKVHFLVDSDSLEELYDLYLETVKPENPVPMYAFDYLYGLQRITQTPIPGYTLEDAGVDDFTLDSTEGVALTGGTEGLLDPAILAAYNAKNVGKEKTREDVLDELFVKAFTGAIDPLILSRKRVPVQFITDANYSKVVKNAMVALFDKRRDFQLYLDAGILSTLEEANLWLGEHNEDALHYGIRYEFQHYKIRDQYSGKKLPVTTMHFLHERLPEIFLNEISRPLAGTQNATLTNHIKNSLLPVLDDDALDAKERFYKKNVGYYTCYGEDLYMRAEQQTSQKEASDLSEENNVRILYDLKRVIEGYAVRTTYDFTTADDREQINKEAQTYVRNYFPTHVESLEIVFKASPWEQKRQINHAYISVVFKGLNKRTIIEIDVNPRATQV